MNRWDEIQGAARDVADWVCGDPADRNRMADDLIKLVCLVVQGVGKGVAIDGESAMNGPDGEADAAGARYLVGEGIQNGARTVLEESSNAGCDLERYERDGLTPAWKADPAKRGAAHKFAPGELTRAAHAASDGMRARKREVPTHESCDPACEAYGHTQSTPDPFGLLGIIDLPLFAPGAEEYYRNALGLGPKPVPVPFTVKHPLQLCDNQDCPAHGDAGRIGHCVQDGPQHVWVTVEEGDPDVLLDRICNICRTPRCAWLPGDATTACDHDPGCSTHGTADARKCPGPPLVQVPVVLHTWVTSTDGDTGQSLDYIHCGVCGIRRCDGGCGDATAGAAPDVDCTTHGNDVARQCVGRCVGCGNPVNVGPHGLNQGFGGCV